VQVCISRTKDIPVLQREQEAKRSKQGQPVTTVNFGMPAAGNPRRALINVP